MCIRDRLTTAQYVLLALSILGIVLLILDIAGISLKKKKQD